MKRPAATVMTGALAGLAGAFAMQQFRSRWNTRVASGPKDGVFGLDDEADINSVNRLARGLLGHELDEKNALTMALALHYGYGAAAGAMYALTAARFPGAAAGYGTLFGLLLWLAGDELPIGVLGISKPNLRSAVSHISALAAHLLFGVVIEGGRRA